MSIGIMDADLTKYILVPFNLECMKLSAYYKQNNQIVVFCPRFTPDQNSVFIYRKDYDDGYFPKGLTTHKNIQYGGLAFSHNTYVPLPIEIEQMRPDTSLYAKMEKTILAQDSPAKYKIYQNLMTAEHCRLSLDGKTIWPDYEVQFQALDKARDIIFHDYDLGAIPNSFETVQSILQQAKLDKRGTTIGMKFPLNIKDDTALLQWSSLKANSTFYSLRFNGVIGQDAFREWISVPRTKAMYSQIEYHITPSWYDENDFILNLLPQIFQQVIISRSYRVQFSLIYDEEFFTDKRWCNVIKLFNFYQHSYYGMPIPAYLTKLPDDTLFDFASHCMDCPGQVYADAMSKAEIRDVFEFVQSVNYELFKDFYELNYRKLGG